MTINCALGKLALIINSLRCIEHLEIFNEWEQLSGIRHEAPLETMCYRSASVKFKNVEHGCFRSTGRILSLLLIFFGLGVLLTNLVHFFTCSILHQCHHSTDSAFFQLLLVLLGLLFLSLFLGFLI